jgi:hypothetical protein
LVSCAKEETVNSVAVEQIARAVLYEGYLLYPYRTSSVKNRQRWTFGGLFPPAYGGEASELRSECLVQGDSNTILEVRVRFLHLLERSVEEPAGNDVDVLESRQEAVQREVAVPKTSLADLAAGMSHPFAFAGSEDRDADSPGRMVVRRQKSLAGVVELGVACLSAPAGQDRGLFRVRARVANVTPVPDAGQVSRDEVVLAALVSTHVLLGVEQGAFVSLTDPPEACREAAATCRNVGVWPVLVGAEGDSDTMLASPIILYDYPRVAPESPGDLFDATEIDEILTLRILTLTDEEKQEISAGDERGRSLLERTEALAREQLLGLHGTLREVRPPNRQVGNLPPRLPIKPGDRVRLRPGPGADVFDRALEGKTATVQAIEQDFEDRVYLSVTVDDDPGKDLGAAGMPGHRFYFRPDEVELLGEDQA